MVKVAVMLAPGFEEIEALAPVDIFRRAGFDCHMIGLLDRTVEGSRLRTYRLLLTLVNLLLLSVLLLLCWTEQAYWRTETTLAIQVWNRIFNQGIILKK